MKLLVLDLDGVLVKEAFAYKLTQKYREEGLEYGIYIQEVEYQ